MVKEIEEITNKDSGKIKQVFEVNIIAYTNKIKDSPRSYFKEGVGRVDVKSYRGLYSYLNSSDKQIAKGDLYKTASNGKGIEEAFNKAVDYQHNIAGLGLSIRNALNSDDRIVRMPIGIDTESQTPGVVTADLDKYRGLLSKISESFFKNKDYIRGKVTKEYQFKAILDGLLTALSDIRYNKRSDKLNVVVATEFQVGGSGRVDIMIQTIDVDGRADQLHSGVPVLLELKLDKNRKKLKKCNIQGKSQLYNYVTSPNIKAITDKENVAAAIVTLGLNAIKNAKNKEDMFITTEHFYASVVEHSSMREKRNIRLKRLARDSDEKAMYRAAKNDDTEMVKLLAKKGVSLDVADENGWRPIHYAASECSLEVADFIYSNGGDINAEDNFGKKPIHIAAIEGKRDFVEFLLSKGVSINERDGDGSVGRWGPLQWAIHKGNLDLTRFLVNRGADMHARDKDDKTPLDLARDRGYSSVSDYLQKKWEASNYGEKAIHFAAQDNDVDAVEFNLQKGASVNAVDNNGWTPMHYAAAAGSLGAAELLAHDGADINVPNKYGFKPIHNAAENGHKDIVKFLVDKGVSVNEPDGNGQWNWQRIPLHWAVVSGRLDLVKFLVNRGADMDAKDKDGRTALDITKSDTKAVVCPLLDWDQSYSHPDVVEYLQKRSEDKNNYEKAIHFAIEDNDVNALKFNLDRGDEVNVVSKYGKVPICMAALGKQSYMVDLLLDKGARIKVNGYGINNTISFSYCLKEILGMDYIDEKYMLQFREAKGNLQPSVKNLVFSDQVCFKNVEFDEYLYAAVDYFEYDKDRRRVFTYIPKTKDEQMPWRIELGPDSNSVYIKNVKFGEYLYSSMGTFDKDRRKVFTWIRDNEKNDQDLWKIEPHISTKSDGIYVTNVHFNEDLYPNIGSYDRERRYVFTWVEDLERNEQTLWKAEDCSEVKVEVVKGKGNSGHDELLLSHKLGIDYSDPIVQNVTGLSENTYGQHKLAHSTSGRKRRAVAKSDQEEQTKATSSNKVVSRFMSLILQSTSKNISNIVDYVKSVSGIMYSTFKPVTNIESSHPSQGVAIQRTDVNSTLMLLDVLVRKITGQKYISTVVQPIDYLEAVGHGINIASEFKTVVEQAGKESGISLHKLDIDFIKVQKDVTSKVASGKFDEISKVLKSHIEKALPSREAGDAGRLSTRKFDKFMVAFTSGLKNIELNQPVQQLINIKNGISEINDVREEQVSLEPSSRLSNASVQGYLTQARNLGIR